jgi:Kelch motif
MTSAELYTPSTGTFGAMGSLNSARRSHTATLLANRTVLVAGGFNGGLALSSAELYLPESKTHLILGAAPGAGGTFEKYDDSGTRLLTGNLSIPRSMHSATLLQNGHVFVAGARATRHRGRSSIRTALF